MGAGREGTRGKSRSSKGGIKRAIKETKETKKTRTLHRRGNREKTKGGAKGRREQDVSGDIKEGEKTGGAKGRSER